MKPRACRGAGTGDVAGVLGYFRLDQNYIKHLITFYSKISLCSLSGQRVIESSP